MSNTEKKAFEVLENVIFLKKADLFAAVKTSDLKAVAMVSELIDFDDGDIIVTENDVGESMYIIKEGAVDIVKNARTAEEIFLAKLESGSCFGDMSVFDTEVRSATVRAHGACKILQINRDQLMDVLLNFPEISLGLLKVLVGRLRNANAEIQKLSRVQ